MCLCSFPSFTRVKLTIIIIVNQDLFISWVEKSMCVLCHFFLIIELYWGIREKMVECFRG